MARREPGRHGKQRASVGARAIVAVAAVGVVVAGVVLLAVLVTRAPSRHTAGTDAAAPLTAAPLTAAPATAAPVAAAPATAAPATAATPVSRPPTTAEVDAAVCRSAGAHRKLFRVSISQQRAWLCNRTALFLATPVTTGADIRSRRTHTGTWKIEHRWPNAWLSGADYNEHVDYWMPYDGQFGIHDASWQNFPFGSARWRTEGSHGCVHVPHAAMKTLFRWAAIGTKVTIVR